MKHDIMEKVLNFCINIKKYVNIIRVFQIPYEIWMLHCYVKPYYLNAL